MATVTRLGLRTNLSKSIGDYESLTTTSGGSATTLIDTGLANLENGTDDDFCKGWYALITSGDANGERKRIQSYVDSTNTVTFESAFSATIATAVTYELHRYDPDDKHAAIDEATELLFPILYKHIRDETVVVDDLLSNSDFETFSGGFTGWTEVGSPTVTAETTRVLHGTNAAKVVAGGSTGQLTQTPSVNQPTMEGKTVTSKFWVWTTDVTSARIRIDWDGGTTFTNGDYHTGADQWELLTASGVVPEGATQVKIILEAAANKTVYWDVGFAVLDPLGKVSVPADIIIGPHYVSEQIAENNPNSDYRRLLAAPLQGRRLRIEGMGLLSLTTSDTDTVELTTPRARLLTSKALEVLNRMLKQKSATQNRARFAQDELSWRDIVDKLSNQRGIAMRRLGTELSMGITPPQWHIEEDSTTKYIVWNHARGTVRGVGFDRNL